MVLEVPPRHVTTPRAHRGCIALSRCDFHTPAADLFSERRLGCQANCWRNLHGQFMCSMRACIDSATGRLLSQAPKDARMLRLIGVPQRTSNT